MVRVLTQWHVFLWEVGMIYFWLIPIALVAIICLLLFYKAVVRSAPSNRGDERDVPTPGERK
jgi:hypothetical protein